MSHCANSLIESNLEACGMCEVRQMRSLWSMC